MLSLYVTTFQNEDVAHLREGNIIKVTCYALTDKNYGTLMVYMPTKHITNNYQIRYY